MNPMAFWPLREPCGGDRNGSVVRVRARVVREVEHVRIGIINVVESGHRVIDAVKPAVLDFLGGEVVASGNLFAGVVDLSSPKRALEEAVNRVDAALSQMRDKVDVIVFVFTGPYIVAYTAFRRLLRSVFGKTVIAAQFDVINKRYVFVEDKELFLLVRKG